MEWKDKQNDIDDVMAEDINELAHEVIRLDGDKADSQNENGGFSAGVNSRAGSGAGIGAWSVAYSGCAAGKYAKAEYGGATGHGAITSNGFAGGYDAKAVDQNDKGIDAVQLGTGTNHTPKTLQVYDYPLLDANGNIPAERLANAPKTDKENQSGGFNAGKDTYSEAGGAIGNNAYSMGGGSVGYNTYSNQGGAVGEGAETDNGFAGGYNAKTTATGENGDYQIDAIQLGTGTNATPKTLQVYNKRIVEADGSLTDVGKLSELATEQKGTIVEAVNSVKNEVDAKPGKSLAGQQVSVDAETLETALEGAEIFNDYRERTYKQTTSESATGNVAYGEYSHAEGGVTTALGDFSHAEGYRTEAEGSYSHAEGGVTKASGQYSHAEGNGTIASVSYSHAEGYLTKASGRSSHAEGERTIASANYSHAEGMGTTASGTQSHAEGRDTLAKSIGSHAEGSNTKANGIYSHAEGNGSNANGTNSHAEGHGTVAVGLAQHVQGRYNLVDEAKNASELAAYAHIVGNGTEEDARSNAHTLDWSGNAWFAGDVTVGEERKRLATIDEAGGKKHSVFVIGTSTSGHTEKDVDYLCDGTDDQVEINAAIQALPAGGGEIKLLDGTYNITSDILMNKQSVVLIGSGMATKLSDSATGTSQLKIAGSYCVVRDLWASFESAPEISGNYNTVIHCALDGISNNMIISGNYNFIENCKIDIFLGCTNTISGTMNQFIGNNIKGVLSSTQKNLFSQNVIEAYSGPCHNFENMNIVSGNEFSIGGFTCKNKNVVCGNCFDNEGGIKITGTYNSIFGNRWSDFHGAATNKGIELTSEASYNNINGNIVKQNKLNIEWAVCISADGSNNLITSNFLSKEVENTGTGNMVTNNLVVAPEE